MPQHPSELRITDFSYTLPDDRIALAPVTPRDASKLLVYKKGAVAHFHFRDIAQLLDLDTMLVLNETRVMPARLLFEHDNHVIEVFCLEVANPKAPFEWHCILGNVRRWKDQQPLLLNDEKTGYWLKAILLERNGGEGLVKFETNHPDAEAGMPVVLEAFGHIPLPPYIKRPDDFTDRERYQTVFAKYPGSVAAPTASLHFTEELMQQVMAKGVAMNQLVLHVGAGTFLPVKSDTMAGHRMHQEEIWVTREAIQRFLQHKGPIAAVGTTAARTLETLYWLGVKCHSGISFEFDLLGQWEAYDLPNSLSRNEALNALLSYMERHDLQGIQGKTGILIAPPYAWKMVDMLVTNFHQPESTLLLLVASFIGDDWKKLYQDALSQAYRFLSYGDACLLIP